ncbi:MAG: sigma factor-like helix-turn-helix DNA-binding protein [Candidatus Omnitrophota bacterium]
MLNSKSGDEAPDVSGSSHKRRTRVREIDFSRVEGTRPEDPLHPFELEVREKLAGPAGSSDDLAAKEHRVLGRRKITATHARLVRLSREGMLTERQQTYFDLFYVDGRSDKEIASRLGVSRSTVRDFRQEIHRRMRHFILEKESVRRMLRSVKSAGLTKKQKQIFRLRYRKGLSVAQIARVLGRRPRAIYALLERTRKIFS